MKTENISKRVKNILALWLPVFIWAGYIFKLSSGSVATVSSVYGYEFTIKSFAHVIFFAILSALIYRALKGSGWVKRKAGHGSIFFSFIYGITDEVHQYFVPVRDARVHDVLFDTIGAILAIYLLWKLLPNLPPRLKNLAKRLQLT